MRISPAGASSVSSVTGSTIGIMPVSSSTVATQIVLVPDMPGYSTCSMITKPASASGPGGRQDHVAAERRVAARLAQHQLAQPVAVIAQVAHLVVHRRAGHVEHAADDHPARLAARVRVDGLDDTRQPHGHLRPLSGQHFHLLRYQFITSGSFGKR